MRTFGWSPTEGELRVGIGFYNYLLFIIFYKIGITIQRNGTEFFGFLYDKAKKNTSF